MAYLVVIRGPGSGTRTRIVSERFTIGSRPDNDLTLSDPSVSPRHAMVRRAPGGRYMIEDLKSAAGTRVNGKPVSAGELTDGATIGIGSAVTLRFLGDAGAQSRVSGAGVSTASGSRISAVRTSGVGATTAHAESGGAAPASASVEPPSWRRAAGKRSGPQEPEDVIQDIRRTLDARDDQPRPKGALAAAIVFGVLFVAAVVYRGFFWRPPQKPVEDDTLRFRITLNKNQSQNPEDMFGRIEHLAGALPGEKSFKPPTPQGKKKVVVEIEESDKPAAKGDKKKKGERGDAKSKRSSQELAKMDLGNKDDLDITILDKRKDPKGVAHKVKIPDALPKKPGLEMPPEEMIDPTEGLPKIKNIGGPKTSAAMPDAVPAVTTSTSAATTVGPDVCEIRLASPVGEPWSFPGVALDDSGDAVIVWQGVGGGGSAYGVYGALFDEYGSPRSGRIRLDESGSDQEMHPSAYMNSRGGFLAVWETRDEFGAAAAIIGRRFDRDGAPLGGEIIVASFSPLLPGWPTIVSDGQSYLVVWQHENDDRLWARRCTESGSPSGAAFALPTLALSEFDPAPPLTSGSFGWRSRDDRGSAERRDSFVVWPLDREAADAFAFRGSRAAILRAVAGTGAPLERAVGERRRWPSAAMDENGAAAAVWMERGENPDGVIVGRRYYPDGNLLCAAASSPN